LLPGCDQQQDAPAAPPKSPDPVQSYYEATTQRLQLLAAEPANPEALRWLAFSHDGLRVGDPRVGPALEQAVKALAARGDFAHDDRVAYAASVAATLGRTRYGPAAATLAPLVDQVSGGDWWAHGGRREALPLLIEAYAQLAPAAGIEAYHRIVSTAVAGLLESEKRGSGGAHLTLPLPLFEACDDSWNSYTVRLFAGLLDGPDSGRIDPERYMADPPSLHSAVRDALAFALPSTDGWTPEQYRALAAQYPDLGAWYLKGLEAGGSTWLADRNYVDPLVARKATAAAPVLDAILEDSRVDPLYRVDYASVSAILGSMRGIEALYVLTTSGPPGISDLAARQLRVLTGVDFGDDYERWTRWLALARERLKWDMEACSWRPATEWERIRQTVEASAETPANGGGRDE
jgi:hypothetical protein